MSELAVAHPQLAFDEAKELTAQIKSATVDLWRLVVKAYEGKAWSAIGYTSWESYVTNEFQMSKQRAHQLLDYAAVRKSLGISDDESTLLTPNEGQTRELRGLEPEQQLEALADAQQTAAATGKPVTAKVVKAAVAKVRAKRNGTAAAPEPPHAPGTITDAELDADEGNPVWLIGFHGKDCTNEQVEEAISLLNAPLPPRKKLLVAVRLYQELPEEERQQFNRLLEAAK